jgi:hypothetical protein
MHRSNGIKLLLEKNIYKRDKNQKGYFETDSIFYGSLLGVCALETFLCDFAVLTVHSHMINKVPTNALNINVLAH